MQNNERKRSRQDNRCCENSRLRGYGYHNKEDHHGEDEGGAEYSQDIRAGSYAARSAPNKKQWDHTRPNQDVSYKHARQAASLYQTAPFEKRENAQRPCKADQRLHPARVTPQTGRNSTAHENTGPSAQRKRSFQ